jgi:regulator-associated protein of mTOR
MRTSGAVLVACLNIGTPPPDIVKPSNSACQECWLDPNLLGKEKGLEKIGNLLQIQYEKYQSKAKFKLCLDPLSDDLRRTCINMRKLIKQDRMLVHYNGHGVPKPTLNGELWVFGKHYTHYNPVASLELKSWVGSPAMYFLV